MNSQKKIYCPLKYREFWNFNKEDLTVQGFCGLPNCTKPWFNKLGTLIYMQYLGQVIKEITSI
jgi:hypothetical protein